LALRRRCGSYHVGFAARYENLIDQTLWNFHDLARIQIKRTAPNQYQVLEHVHSRVPEYKKSLLQFLVAEQQSADSPPMVRLSGLNHAEEPVLTRKYASNEVQW
jgi:hypothetical protein